MRAGRLKGEKRDDFITSIANENILLAIQCAVECEENPNFEQKLIEQAEISAKNFSDSIASERGILALAKINASEKILEVFKSIEQPNHIHKQVINNLINNSEPTQSLDFILLLLNLPSKKTQILYWAILSFDIARLPNHYDKAQKTTARLLRRNRLFTIQLAIDLIAKYDLNKKFLIPNIIKQLIKKQSKKFNKAQKIILKLVKKHQLDKAFVKKLVEVLIKSGRGNRLELALDIIKERQLQKYFPILSIVYKLIETGSKRPVQLAIKLIEEHQLEHQFSIQNIIQKLIQNGSIHSTQLAVELIKEHQLEHQFSVQISSKTN
jgi:hypothetical protein